MGQLSRRLFLGGAACAVVGSAGRARASARPGDAPGARLFPWMPGQLDIHHLATGRGDATLIVGPDGRTVLIDAGATKDISRATLPARPNDRRRPGEWIARYVRRRLLDTGKAGLDMLLVTHLHPDHTEGIADVARALPIERLIDADFPDYGYPPFEDAAASEKYIAYVRDRIARGAKVERFEPGRNDQLDLGNALEVRNLAARGVVWTGMGSETLARFPPREQLAPGDHPNVNAGSIACRLKFGAFAYFIGGDLTDWADAGTRPWMDALTPAAQSCGRVDVAVAPHHGMFDASGSATVRALAARVWIISAWHAAHPSISTLERLFNERLYAGPRSVYLTGLSPFAERTQERLTRRVVSRSGHIVVRVRPGGAGYSVVVTSNDDEADRVIRVDDFESLPRA